jgi:hypothetical protein
MQELMDKIDTSYVEQLQAVGIGVCTINKYTLQLGPNAATYTKNIIVLGVPGSGKSYVTKWLHLFVLSRGLRVFLTAVMGVRALSIAGEHMHKLFGLSTKKNGNIFSTAEIAIDKMNQKRNMSTLHALTTMDILLFDNFGQLSVKQLKILDIILRKIFNTDTFLVEC